MKMMNKLRFTVFSFFLLMLTGCSKSVDYYMKHPDEARSKAETCRWKHNDSSECVNALTAVKKLDQKTFNDFFGEIFDDGDKDKNKQKNKD